MKKIIYTFVLLIIIFLLNLLLFFLNDSYKKMIYDLKHKNSEKFWKNITDDYNVDKEILSKINKKIEENINENNNNEKINNNDDEFFENEAEKNNIKKELEGKKEKSLEEKKEELRKQMQSDKIKENTEIIDSLKLEEKEKTISYSKKEKANIDFIRWAFKWYKLKNQKEKNIIFNLSSEYPIDRYLEYYSPNLSLYFFINTSYEKVFEIFDVLSYEDSFKINKTDSFWNKSFYLNRFRDDWFIRLVIEYKKHTFWIQVKKEYYDNTKSILISKLR